MINLFKLLIIKKLVLPIAMAFMMSPMLSATNFSMEEFVFESCFDQADESTENNEGTYQEKHEAFLKAYDECKAEQE